MKGKKKKDTGKSSRGFSFHSILGKVAGWLKKALLFFFISTFLVALLYRFVPVHYTPLMFIRCCQQKMEGREMHMKSTWVPLSEISPEMVNAVIVSEDWNFMSHFGFDFTAIQKASERNKREGKLYGASTISQQTAKNVFLWPDRTWIRKGFEAYFTLLIEALWNKERIMEVYLNVVELGDGIYGVEAASMHYFGKPARRLSPSQAALLSATLPSPKKYDPAHPSSYLYRKEKKIVKMMSYHERVDFSKEE